LLRVCFCSFGRNCSVIFFINLYYHIQASFDSQRKVVEEEFRATVLAEPYGRFYEAYADHGFDTALYRRPVIGRIDDLRAATLAEVRAFHARWYRPDNAVLLVCGPHDARALDAAVRRHFEPLPRPAEPLRRGAEVGPRRQPTRAVTLRVPNVPLPAAALLWPGPPARHADAPALRVAAALLASGDASRFNDALVYRAQIAQAAGCSTELYAEAGLVAAYAVAAGDARPAQLEAALLRQIDRLARDGATPAELGTVRARLLTDTLIEHQRAEGRCDVAGWALALHGDVTQANAQLPALLAVDSAEVRRVLRRYLVDVPPVRLGYARERA
jgi:zinc protease